MSDLYSQLVDVMGNRRLTGLQRSLLLWRSVREGEPDPDRHPEWIRMILESYGLAPRHETPVAVESFKDELAQRVLKISQARIDHELKGWFEIDNHRPIERRCVEICFFLNEWTDEQERAVVFERILSSRYVPIPAQYFSRYMDEAEKDRLLLRQHSRVYIQLRQLLNMKIGPTERGALIQDFLAPLAGDPYAQAVVFGAFLEELLQRLRQKSSPVSPAAPAKGSTQVMTFPIDMSGGQFQEMMRKMQQILPPEVLEQLRRLFMPPGGTEPWSQDPHPSGPT